MKNYLDELKECQRFVEILIGIEEAKNEFLEKLKLKDNFDKNKIRMAVRTSDEDGFLTERNVKNMIETLDLIKSEIDLRSKRSVENWFK